MKRQHPKLSISRQCVLLSLSRAGFYYRKRPESALNLELMRVMDEQHLDTPWYGSRQMTRFLIRQGYAVSRKRVRRLMQVMGLSAIYQKPNTSLPNKQHQRYPYLLRNVAIRASNQVWCTDITYIPMERGFLYLVAVMDWYSRKVLSWRLSNTLEVDFCVEAVQEAMARYGIPEIFNTDQGSQFTSEAFTSLLKQHHIRISMDGKGRWVDNVMIERLWRTLKYECIYLQAFTGGKQLKQELRTWFDYYNGHRPHSTFNGQTPNEVYNQIIHSRDKMAA